MKNTAKNQAFSQVKNISLQIIEEPFRYMDSQSRLYKALLNLLLCLQNRHYRVYPSQGKLAQLLGCSVRQVQRLLDKMEEEGLVKKIRRSYTSCLYEVSQWFWIPEIKQTLSSFFSALKMMPLFILFVSPLKTASRPMEHTNVVLSYNDNKNYSNSYKKHVENSLIFSPLNKLGVIFSKKEEEELLKQPECSLLYAISEFKRQIRNVYSPFRFILYVSKIKTTNMSNPYCKLPPPKEFIRKYPVYKSPEYLTKIDKQKEISSFVEKASSNIQYQQNLRKIGLSLDLLLPKNEAADKIGPKNA